MNHLNGVRVMVVEMIGGHMVVSDLPTPWADSRHLLFEVGRGVWRENITDLTFPG